jgi:hypothetical protein
MSNYVGLVMLTVFGGALTFGVWVLRAAVRVRADHVRMAANVVNIRPVKSITPELGEALAAEKNTKSSSGGTTE